MSLAAMVAGAPFFLGEGEGDGVSARAFPPLQVSRSGSKKAWRIPSDVGEGRRFAFLFLLWRSAWRRFWVRSRRSLLLFPGRRGCAGSAVSAGVGLGEAFLFFEGEGDGDFSGVADGFGVGDFSAVSVFFEVVELLRCFRGAGVGVGAKIFLILLPNDSSAGALGRPRACDQEKNAGNSSDSSHGAGT